MRTTWNNSNKEWFIQKGYNFTGLRKEFYVKAKDLKPRCSQKIHAICDYCGAEYTTQMDVITSGREKYPKDCCAKCAGKKASDMSRARRAKKYLSELDIICKENGYTLLTTESEYIDLHMKVKYLCPKHGVQESSVDNLIRGHMCFECSYETRFETMKLDQDYVDDVISSVGDSWLNKGEYVNSCTHNLHIRCKCGNDFTTSFNNFVRAGVTTCYSCSCRESSGELIIRNFLTDNGIDFVYNKRFDDCRDKKPLPFDFFLPKYNMCIEFDGQHHFMDIPTRSKLEDVQRHDIIKDKYCKDNGIKMLRIPYYDGHHIEDILTKELEI